MNWVLIVHLAFGGIMSLPYPDQKTCLADAKLLDQDKKFVAWVECNPAISQVKERKH